MKNLLLVVVFILIQQTLICAQSELRPSLGKIHNQDFTSQLKPTSISDRLIPSKRMNTISKSTTASIYVPDTIIYYHTKSRVSREIITWNSNKYITSLLSQSYSDDAWVNDERITAEYDANDNVIIELYENWINNNWENFERVSYTFDAIGDEITFLYETWTNNAWVIDYQTRTTNVYDAFENMLSETVEINRDTAWTNLRKTSYTYDSNGFMLTKLEYVFASDPWEYGTKYSYTYDSNGNMLTEIVEQYNNDAWNNNMRYSYTYDSNGNMLTELIEQYYDDAWNNTDRNNYTYDSNGNMLTELNEYYNIDAWVNWRRYNYTYDSNGNMLTELHENYSNDAWVISGRNNYTYDSNGNMLTELSERYYNDAWINYSRNNYTYDPNGNILIWEWFHWDGTSWHQIYEEPCIYVVNGVKRQTYDQGVKIQFHWISAEVTETNQPSAAITYNDSDIRYADDLLITATFSEPMDSTNAVKLSLSGASTLTEADMTRENDTVYTYSFQVPKASGLITVTLSNGTNLAGNEVVSTPTSGGTFTIIGLTYGDINDDGFILDNDAELALQHSVGFDPLPTEDPLPWESWRYTTTNVDGLAGITAYDASMIMQFSEGIITSFQAEGKKSVSIAEVTIEVANNEIVFYSNGGLLGLNVSTYNENQILGTPVDIAANFLSAFNISETKYLLGLCTAYPPADGDPIMKIPYDKNGSVTFNLNVNTEQNDITVDLATGFIEFANKDISTYPNPVTDILTIDIDNPDQQLIEITSLNGQLIHNGRMEGTSHQIDLSPFQKGVYFITIRSEDFVTTRKIIKL